MKPQQDGESARVTLPIRGTWFEVVLEFGAVASGWVIWKYSLLLWFTLATCAGLR